VLVRTFGCSILRNASLTSDIRATNHYDRDALVDLRAGTKLREGSERDVLRGVHELLEAGVLGVEAESNFRHQSDLPERALATLHEMLPQHGLLVFDMGFNRIPRASFQRALVRNGPQDHCG
jgi:hypothetical protein